MRLPAGWLSDAICEYFTEAEVPEDAVIVLKLKHGEEVYAHQLEEIHVRWSTSEEYKPK